MTGVTLINTHHSIWGGFASKNFNAKLRLWENHKIWHSVAKGTLDDTQGKVRCSSATKLLKVLKILDYGFLVAM